MSKLINAILKINTFGPLNLPGGFRSSVLSIHPLVLPSLLFSIF